VDSKILFAVICERNRSTLQAFIVGAHSKECTIDRTMAKKKKKAAKKKKPASKKKKRR